MADEKSVGIEDDMTKIHYPSGFIVKMSNLKSICDDLKNIRDYMLKKQNLLEVLINASRKNISDLTEEMKKIEDSVSSVKGNISRQNKKIDQIKKDIDDTLEKIENKSKKQPIPKTVLKKIKEDLKKELKEEIKPPKVDVEKIMRELRKDMESEIKKKMKPLKEDVEKTDAFLRKNLRSITREEFKKYEEEKRKRKLKEAKEFKGRPFGLTKEENEVAELLEGNLKPREISIITGIDIKDVQKMIRIIKKKMKI